MEDFFFVFLIWWRKSWWIGKLLEENLIDGGKSDGGSSIRLVLPSLWSSIGFILHHFGPPSIRFSSINLLTHQLVLHQGPWTLSIKNAPTYFFTSYTKKYVLGPDLGDRRQNWVKGQSVHFLQGLKQCVSITLDWGSLMSVNGHDSFLDNLGIVHAYKHIRIFSMKYGILQ